MRRRVSHVDLPTKLLLNVVFGADGVGPQGTWGAVVLGNTSSVPTPTPNYLCTMV